MPPKKEQQRLDLLIYQRGLAVSQSKAQALIMAGAVQVNGQPVYNAGMRYAVDADVTVKKQPLYVSRGGEKLAGALQDFVFDPAGLICADVGASTGGFTDCLLQHNADHIYAIDVGYGHLAHKLRIDQRVIVMERTNARHIETLPEPIDLSVIDASFISLGLLLPVVVNWLKKVGHVIALIKPQFEAHKSEVARGGIVADRDVHARILYEVIQISIENRFQVAGLTVSPLKGRKSENTEFFIHLQKSEQQSNEDNFSALIQNVLDECL